MGDAAHVEPSSLCKAPERFGHLSVIGRVAPEEFPFVGHRDEGDALELLVLPQLGVLVVVVLLPIWVVVLSRICLLALSQHLPWVTLAEGVVVVEV